MSDRVKLVYRGPDRVRLFPGMDLLFVKDEPEDVTPEQAKMIMGNNPTPEQAKREKFHDFFEIVGEPVPARSRERGDG